MRKVMMPATTAHLKEKKGQKLKDMVEGSIALNCNNLIVFSETNNFNMKIITMPEVFIFHQKLN